MTTKQLIDALNKEFRNFGYHNPDCYNKRPGKGYTVPGNSKWTMAVNRSVVSKYSFNWWSGSAPTPSTQIPTPIAKFLKKIDN
jgi:hypothetical protein